MNNPNEMIKNIKAFQNTLKGDPTKQLNNLLQSGNVPQNVLDRAQSVGKEIYKVMKNL